MGLWLKESFLRTIEFEKVWVNIYLLPGRPSTNMAGFVTFPRFEPFSVSSNPCRVHSNWNFKYVRRPLTTSSKWIRAWGIRKRKNQINSASNIDFVLWDFFLLHSSCVDFVSFMFFICEMMIFLVHRLIFCSKKKFSTLHASQTLGVKLKDYKKKKTFIFLSCLS